MSSKSSVKIQHSDLFLKLKIGLYMYKAVIDVDITINMH